MSLAVKICGLNSADAVDAAVEGGARYAGFVFFPPSPRHVEVTHARSLVCRLPRQVGAVGLVVNASDQELDDVCGSGVAMLQLHGRESISRVVEIRQRWGRPVIKAVAIGGPEDVRAALTYEEVADFLLFDARPPKGADRPGGNAVCLDWQILRSVSWRVPWFLAGGLDVGNLAAAVSSSGARMVDVSSGVEDAPGVKSLEKIKRFLSAASAIDASPRMAGESDPGAPCAPSAFEPVRRA